MFGLGINYLNGWAMAAADGARKERAEWPPHPDRVFMAMAAAWFETGQDEKEKKALEWFEGLPPPQMVASAATVRGGPKDDQPVTSYVPVNDVALSRNLPGSADLKKLKDAGLAILPELRTRQPRKFPVILPDKPVVYLVWEQVPPEPMVQSLAELCRRVTCVGHSASLVQMWITKDPPEPNLVPVHGPALYRMRVFGPGRLSYLQSRYNKEKALRYLDLDAAVALNEERRKEIDNLRKVALKGLKGAEKKAKAEPFMQTLSKIDETLAAQRDELTVFGGKAPISLRPEPGLWQGYASPTRILDPTVAKGLFNDRLVVLSLTGKRMSLTATLKLTETLRATLLSICSEPVPEWISGHQHDGAYSTDPHLAIIPMPFVGSAHADGRIMGTALAIPSSIVPSDVAKIFDPWLRDEYGIARTIKLFNGQWLECALALETRETPPWNLRSETWAGPSKSWASVTPVVLDRHFDGKDKWERAAEIVKDGCERIGLPRPEKVLLHPVSLVEGVPHAREFVPIKRKKDNGRMHHCHAVILFSEPVMGPVLVGAGRFRGYGLCRPMDYRRSADE